jgi:hypothetical protein
MPMRIDGRSIDVAAWCSGAEGAPPKTAAASHPNDDIAMAWRSSPARCFSGAGTAAALGIGSLAELIGARELVAPTRDSNHRLDLLGLVSSIIDFAAALADGSVFEPKKSQRESERAQVATQPSAGGRPLSSAHSSVAGRSTGLAWNAERCVSVEDGVESGVFGAHGAAQGRAGARVETAGSVLNSPDCVIARAKAEAMLGASAAAQGTVVCPLGTARGQVSASADLFARVEGEVSAGARGAEARGLAEAGALATIDAAADARILSGLATARARGLAQSGAGAQANAEVVASIAPPQAIVRSSAGAFAGARAGVEATAGVLGASERMTAEAWAGVGAKFGISLGLKDGVFSFEVGIGAALGVGAYASMAYEFDLKDLLRVPRMPEGRHGDPATLDPKASRIATNGQLVLASFAGDTPMSRAIMAAIEGIPPPPLTSGGKSKAAQNRAPAPSRERRPAGEAVHAQA